MKILSILFILIFSFSVFGQDVLTNKDIIDMTQGGLSATVITTKIKNSKSNFNTTTTALKVLADAKVASEVISLMVNEVAAYPPKPTQIKETQTQPKIITVDSSSVKQREKERKQAAKIKSKENVFELDRVGTFPQEYVNRTLRFKRVFLYDIQNHTENGETLYFVGIKTANKTFYANAFADSLNFVTDTDTAKVIYDFSRERENINTFGDTFPVNITVDIKSLTSSNNSTYYFARINCIEFLGVLAGKLKIYGAC